MLRSGVVIGVFVLTMILVVRRPYALPEAVWTCLGAVTLLSTGLVSWADVQTVLHAAAEPLLFLGALLLLAALIERSGFFEWAALRAARLAAGDGAVLYRNVFILGAAITAVLSLDTTAVILTPIVLALVRRLELPARPFIFACAFVANMGSLALPVSNLTNLLFVSAFELRFADFALRLALPNLVALATNYWLFCRLFRAQVPAKFALAQLPPSNSVVPHAGFFAWSVGVLASVCIGYFVAPAFHVAPYVVGFCGAAVLLLAGLLTRRVGTDLARDIPWSIFPFITGLFVVVQAVEALAPAGSAAALMESLPSAPWLSIPTAAFITGAASNVVNNLPAALLARDALQAGHAPLPMVYGALLGTNLGPNILVSGSLATMLVLSRARESDDAPSNADVFWVGLRVT
ncbi:MAG: Na+/H+ antiporter NhaD and related arsenite permease, partial [Myxococcaceae bacterium]|nr:Na+/H+ antiporter NhaD and related arsenite permease [Myxococcaceae bacterium]